MGTTAGNPMNFKLEDIGYMLTLHCPGRCVNCKVWTKRREEVIKGETNLDIFESVLSSVTAKDVIYFDLTGGESLLSEKYAGAVEIISRYRPDAFIHTNTSGPFPERHYEVVKKCLEYIDPGRLRIDVSLDGTPMNYARLRLVRDGWRKAVRTAELLKSLGIVVRFTMILYKENYRDIEWFIEFAEKTGIGHYIGYARGSKNYLDSVDRAAYFSAEEMDYIEGVLNKSGWLTARRKTNWLWAKSIYENNVLDFTCRMGERSITIDPYGSVFPCNEMMQQLNMGNLKDCGGDLDSLLHSGQALEVMKIVREKKCQPCRTLCAHKIEFPSGALSNVACSGTGSSGGEPQS